ncbi:Arm DNA-binding domain-containing protein [Pseudescherichia sp.]|uniref:Arm DNA-binding domain-containing protein n=1 Tax=Pseudescherichia sp. TaxID=2055881 RepID=UPI0028A15B94|nr:DUF3596 domain-containing protein [Pseudescherichia sp.]
MNHPTGVELHNGKIRIWFLYKGVRCREVLQGWSVTNANLRKAGNLRATIVGEIQLGTFDYASRFPESKAASKFSTVRRVATFKELCDVYLSAKSLEVSAASYDSLASKISTLRNVVGDNTPIAEIQHSDILNYRHELLTGDVVNLKAPWFNKKGRGASTVNNLVGALCGMLRLAHQSQFISHAPYEHLKSLKVSKKDPDPLLIGEYHSLLKALPRRFALIWIVAVHTGLRHGELCALAWEDIDLSKGEIHVGRNLTAKGLFVPPKTEAGIRTITLLQPALDALKELFAISGNYPSSDIVFHHREHGRTEEQRLKFVFSPGARKGHYSKRSISYSWQRGIDKAGIRYRHPYQSRHTFACWLLSAGANPSFIANQMGHDNAKMVYTVYSKWISDMNVDQISMLNGKLLSVMSP